MFKNLSIRAVLTTALVVFFTLFLVTGIAVYQQLTSNRNSIERLLETNLVRANAVDGAASELLRARLVLVAAQTALMEGKRIDNLASMQRLDRYTKEAADLIQTARQTPETTAEGKPLFDAALAAYDVYHRDAIVPMIAAIRAGNAQEAGRLNLEKSRRWA